MQDVFLELIIPLALAVVFGIGLGWYMWRRGRAVITQNEYETLLRQPMLAPLPSRTSFFDEPEVGPSPQGVVPDEAIKIQTERLRTEKEELAAAAAVLTDELTARDRTITKLMSESSALEEELRYHKERMGEAHRTLEHSEIYIRALEAELRLTPTASPTR